ncbi:MAG TPA: sulfatase-like hydrolase/transferase [Pseudolabrys sp.]|jgi:lipid A ethanolaminephosphotransferase|nr:sulfatase-like hydrolase/transferase [Pseudolabrys sp.]
MKITGIGRTAAYAARLAALAAFVVLTNAGFAQRIALLHDQGRWVTLVGFIGIWGLSLAAIIVAAFQRSVWIRCAWALVIALTTAAGFTYRHASGSELGIFDALSLWNARHEASRAAAFYSTDLLWLALVFVGGFAAIAVPPVPNVDVIRRWLTRLFWVPAVPIIAIAAIVLFKEGGGSEVLPTQFAPLSVGAVVVSKVTINPLPKRAAVAWTWRGPFAVAAPRAEVRAPRAPVIRAAQVRHVVMLVDESVRGDYIDWTPNNPYTPELAHLKSKLVNFGPAVSGGNCSHYSNAILRFGASRTALGRPVLTSPTIWQYAKKAGFRTVYIDAQAAFNRNPGKLQNFMTAEETRDIDGFNALDEKIAPPDLDDRLLDIVINELKSDKPVFIYANKNGAHFPYDNGYPMSARVFRPTMNEVEKDETQSRVNSFRNVVKWSVDRFMKRLFDEAALKDTVIIYTSDHGQNFNPARLSHCTVEDPDPREGLVPLFVYTDNKELKSRFADAAKASMGHASHFSIIPTVLELFGYGHEDVEKIYGESLLEKNTRPPEFTTGDIFGLFSSKVRWHPLDLTKSYLEPAAISQLATHPDAGPHQAKRKRTAAR